MNRVSEIVQINIKLKYKRNIKALNVRM